MSHAHHLSILYLDDEPSCLNIFRQMLGDDYEVRTAQTLVEARLALAEESFDIVVSDYSMPETDGLTFLREVAATQADSYRVLLTGALGVGDVVWELGGGAIHSFLKKPWDEDSLRAAVELAGASRPWAARGARRA